MCSKIIEASSFYAARHSCGVKSFVWLLICSLCSFLANREDETWWIYESYLFLCGIVNEHLDVGRDTRHIYGCYIFRARYPFRAVWILCGCFVFYLVILAAFKLKGDCSHFGWGKRTIWEESPGESINHSCALDTRPYVGGQDQWIKHARSSRHHHRQCWMKIEIKEENSAFLPDVSSSLSDFILFFVFDLANSSRSVVGLSLSNFSPWSSSFGTCASAFDLKVTKATGAIG